jgi:hypothetical protein
MMINFRDYYIEEAEEPESRLGPEPDRGEELAMAAARLEEGEGLVYFEGGAVVQRKSGISGEINKIWISGLTQEQYDAWRNGALIQRAMPQLSADEREFLKTGITPEEWKKIFGGDEEEEEEEEE